LYDILTRCRRLRTKDCKRGGVIAVIDISGVKNANACATSAAQSSKNAKRINWSR
jgi:hypothetical protein